MICCQNVAVSMQSVYKEYFFHLILSRYTFSDACVLLSPQNWAETDANLKAVGDIDLCDLTPIT